MTNGNVYLAYCGIYNVCCDTRDVLQLSRVSGIVGWICNGILVFCGVALLIKLFHHTLTCDWKERQARDFLNSKSRQQCKLHPYSTQALFHLLYRIKIIDN